jgi:Spy/CpxP family protein refolding chaperone
MRKTLIALMFAAALPTVAMAMPPADGPGSDGPCPEGPRMGMGMHHDRGPLAKLDLTREQRQQIGKLMGAQMHDRKEVTEKYLAKLPAADQKAMKDEMEARRAKTQADIRALLKPDQQKEFDEMQKERAQRMADREEFEAWKAQKAQKAQ